MAIFQIKDGFCINTSGVDGQEIDTISTEITSAASDNVLVTQKAIKDYVDEHGGGGGSIPISSAGDMVIGDENGEPSTLTIGTSGQTLMVNSSGMLEYCDILSRSSVSTGNTIGTYTTSATNNNFLDIRGKYGYNTQNAESITNSGVRLSLNESLFRVNTHGFDLGSPYRIDWLGCGIRYRKTASRKSIMLLGDTGSSTTSAYSVIGNALAVGTTASDIYIGAYNNSNRATSALNSFDPYGLMSYTNAWSYGGRIRFMFPSNCGPVPEWSGASYNVARSYLSLGRGNETNNPSGMFEICSSATNKYGDTRAKCDTVAFRVKSGWSIFHDKIMFRATSCTTAPIYARKIVTGRTWPNDVIPVSQQQADGGVVYGYGETSARDALTTYGKDPGRQYYTTDDHRVNVYNDSTSAWDQLAYLSDVGGGGGGMVNPMTSAGDIIVGGTSGDPTALPKGANNTILSVNWGNVEWTGLEAPLGLDETQSGQLFYSEFEDTDSNAKAGVGYTCKLKKLEVGAKGKVLTVGDGPTYHNQGVECDQLIPTWADPELPSIESYPLALTDDTAPNESAFANNLCCTKIFCNINRTVSKMGFFHKSGTTGVVGMAIYNADGSLVAKTAVEGVSSSTEGGVCWKDLDSSVSLEKGKLYWFAFFVGWAPNEWTYNIKFAHNTSVNGASNAITIKYQLGSGTTAMPNTMTSTIEGNCSIWLVAD